MLKKALILTVGTGTRADVDIVKPLVKTIKDSAPSFLGFIVSDVSRPHAEEIVRQLGLSQKQFDIIRLSDADSLDTIYSEINAWFRSLLQRGYSTEEVTIDFTSGTKSMTSGAVLAGVAWGCAGLKYISGIRQDGVVQNGTERFLTVQPNKILSHRETEIGRRLIEAMRFEAAMNVFSSINQALLDAYEKELIQGLTQVARAYDYWDKFVHNRAVGYLCNLPESIGELDPFRIPRTVHKKLIAIHKAIENGEIIEALLADLYNNAQRRCGEGKYDDAVARLYRLAEMLAQMTLWKAHGIHTGDVLEERIPEAIRETFRSNRDPADGKIKIGLQKSYEILRALGNPLGESFFESKRLSALLKQRNESFLAHGTEPISRDACQSLFDETRGLLVGIIESFDELCDELRFPWQRLQE